MLGSFEGIELGDLDGRDDGLKLGLFEGFELGILDGSVEGSELLVG